MVRLRMTSQHFPENLRQRFEQYPQLVHLPGWVLYMLLPSLIISFTPFFNEPELIRLFSIKAVNDALSIGFFYVNYYRLTQAILKHHRTYRQGLAVLGLAVLGLSCLLALTNALYYQFQLKDGLAQFMANGVGTNMSLTGPGYWMGTPAPLLLYPFLAVTLLTGVSSGFAIYTDRNQHKARYQQMIIEKKEAELNALKLQISPHFLFNTLNSMRWLARQKSEATEEAIQQLSDMLRYMIYQVDRGPVALSREIEYLSDYIQLQRLRLASHHQIVFETDVTNDRIVIEPLLLIHFVENAFKHGMHHDQASTVTIRLQLNQNTLSFSTRNRLFVQAPSPPSDHSGIGIQNVEKRLASHYPTQHTLRIYHQDGLFCVDLVIDLTTALHETPQYSH